MSRTEPIVDQAPDVAPDLLGDALLVSTTLPLWTRCSHVRAAFVLEGLAKIRHRDPIARGDVDASQQHDQARHR
mgnify:CR=1 FL=1